MLIVIRTLCRTSISTSVFTSTSADGQLITVTALVTRVISPDAASTPSTLPPTSHSLNNDTAPSSSFFSNSGAVAGVFIVVGLILCGIIVGAAWFVLRRRRSKRLSADERAAAGGAGAGGAGVDRFGDDDEDDEVFPEMEEEGMMSENPFDEKMGHGVAPSVHSHRRSIQSLAPIRTSMVGSNRNSGYASGGGRMEQVFGDDDETMVGGVLQHRSSMTRRFPLPGMGYGQPQRYGTMASAGSAGSEISYLGYRNSLQSPYPQQGYNDWRVQRGDSSGSNNSNGSGSGGSADGSGNSRERERERSQHEDDIAHQLQQQQQYHQQQQQQHYYQQQPNHQRDSYIPPASFYSAYPDPLRHSMLVPPNLATAFENGNDSETSLHEETGKLGILRIANADSSGGEEEEDEA